MDLSQILKVVCPWIGTALGGPLGGMAVQAAADALGISDKTVDAVKQALSGATPEQMLALKQADQNFALKMQELGFKQLADLEAIAAGDRKDARALQSATRSLIPAVLSVIITTGFLGLLTGMMMGYLHSTDNQAMMLMLGALGVAFGQVTNFWLGSTAESGHKTELLSRANPVK